jgi:hypothetical protein
VIRHGFLPHARKPTPTEPIQAIAYAMPGDKESIEIGHE